MQHLSRRALVWMAGAAPLLSLAQGQRFYRLGLLSYDMGPPEMSLIEALEQLGYHQGRTMSLETRFYQGNPQSIDAHAAELVALKPDVIIAGNNVDIIALQKQTKTIPIVMRRSFAPVEMGFIQAYNRPGGNITGVTHWPPSEDGKSMQLLHDFAPSARRFCTLTDPRLVGIKYYKDQQLKTCAELGLELAVLPMRNEVDLEDFFRRAVAEKYEAMEFADSGYMGERRDDIVAFCERQKIITLSSREAAVQAGVVLARIPDVQGQSSRCASFIDRILKGASPADIPVEGPMRYELLLNEKAARKIGVLVPKAFRLQVTRIVG